MATSIILRKGYIINRADRAISYLFNWIERTDISSFDRFVLGRALTEITQDYALARDGDPLNLQFLEVALELYTENGILRNM